MLYLTTCALATTMLLAGGSDIIQAIRKDKAGLQGTWKVVSSESNGEKVPADDLKGLAIIFRGNAIFVREGAKEQEKFGMLLDPLRKPKEMDLAFLHAPNKGRLDRAIYDLDGDALRICIQENKDSPRPTDFTAPANSNRWLVVLKRSK